jgi:hypothetical protein
MQSMAEKIKSEVGTAMHMKWEEMKVGVRREISEEVQRRVALSNQQNEGEHLMMKNKVREIMNEMVPLTEEVHTLNQEMERTSRLAQTVLSAGGTAEARLEYLQKTVQGSPWGQDPSHPSHPSQL